MATKNKKFMLLVGSFGWFADSLRIFAEKGYDGYFTREPALKYFDLNYGNFATLGFKEIAPPFEDILRGNYDGGIILSGNQYDPFGSIYPHCDKDLPQLAAYAQHVTVLKEFGPPVLAVRCINGDTFFCNQPAIHYFERYNRQTDLLIADSDNVEKYVKAQCKQLREKRWVVSPVDAPLGRYCATNDEPDLLDYYLHSGRPASTRLPGPDDKFVYLPANKIKKNPGAYDKLLNSRWYRIAGHATIDVMERDRNELRHVFGRFKAGIGHFYDFFNSPEGDCQELYYEMAQKQNLPGPIGKYELPKIYRLTNTPSKVLMYLMLGIPPVIPKDAYNAFHKQLMDLDLCIPVDRDGVLPDLPADRLMEIRSNIRANTQVYTFNPTFSLMDAALERRITNPRDIEEPVAHASAVRLTAPRAKNGGKRVVAVVPAGRKRYMEIMLPYLLRSRDLIDECQIWVNTAIPEDVEYLKSLGRKDPEFFRLIYSVIPINFAWSLLHFSKHTREPNTVYLRFDDDICWMADDAIEKLLQFRLRNPRPFLVYANIVNNSVCSHIHQRMGRIPTEAGLVSYDVFCKNGWENGPFAEVVHRTFLKHLYGGMTGKYLFDRWDITHFERVSINCCAWFGEAMPDYPDAEGDEEQLWAVEYPKKQQSPSVICGDALVAHFAYYTQRPHMETTNLLEEYRQLGLKLAA